MWTKKTSNNNGTTLTPATVSQLGGVKVGTGLTVQNDGTISTSTTTAPLSEQITGIYLVPNKLSISKDSTSSIILTPSTGQKLYIYYLNKVVSYDVPAITVPNNTALRVNVSTGAFRAVSDANLLSNEILLLKNINADITLGEFLQYVDFYNNDDVEVIAPKDYQSTTYSGSTSGICFVGNEMWIFAQTTDDTHTSTASITRKDPANNFSVLGTMTHNIGHCNTVDYNSTIDSLIVGNGSKDYTLLPKGWIFPNITAWKSMSNIDWNTIPKVELDFTAIYNVGKCQLVWGENNFGGNDIVYLILNDNKLMARVLLGKGSTNLGSGNFVSGVASNSFNGSFKIIEEWNQFDGGGVNQDSFYYNGAIYANTNSGSITGLVLYKHKLCANGVIKKTAIRFPYYDATGNIVGHNGEGLALYNGKIYANYDFAPIYRLIWFDLV